MLAMIRRGGGSLEKEPHREFIDLNELKNCLKVRDVESMENILSWKLLRALGDQCFITYTITIIIVLIICYVLLKRNQIVLIERRPLTYTRVNTFSQIPVYTYISIYMILL